MKTNILIGLIIILVAVSCQKKTGESPRIDTVESDRWIEEPGDVPGVPNTVFHWYATEEQFADCKLFHSKGSQNFYFNGRHGFFVLLPKEMGYNQEGEPQLGGHWNQFYNNDTTLVIASGATFYDVLLDDHPHYDDTLRNLHLENLHIKGKVEFLSRKPDEIVAKVIVDKANPENPPSDYLLNKWVLKKDIGGRECDMTLDIWYNDSLKYRESEFLNIINKFPNNPF